jgi:hypothetical protein
VSWHLDPAKRRDKALTRAERALLVALRNGGSLAREASKRSGGFHYVLVKAKDGLPKLHHGRFILGLYGRGALQASGAQKVPTSLILSPLGRTLIEQTDREGRPRRQTLRDILRKETA